MCEFREVEVVCPKCGQDDFNPYDGETDPEYTYYDCKCNNCDADFTVTLRPCKIRLNKKVEQ